MQHKEMVEVPATSREVVVKVTCDLCKKEIKEEGYQVNEVTITHRTGDNYPEMGSGEEASVDMCGECFELKLTPWLKSQGAEPLVAEWEW